MLRPGNANTAADQLAACEAALGYIPQEHMETIELLVRVDSAGATHELVDWWREGRIRYSVGSDLTEPVRAAILELAEESCVSALDQDGGERPKEQVAEITDVVDLGAWPEGSR
jgi:hypothetical protein